ncbi:cuticular protein, putative [Ixodes scapularis]|uniref:Cuticular protein, putative n=1 Tax=Ixodes scapularis TaxID=6945 RepID=B7PWW3_IXOSC|nr:cuticular protein, putative [Ixodes scapularis]|eukprot:XP_002410358.1 cuticular protein, putative [Ixodes scapularis]
MIAQDHGHYSFGYDIQDAWGNVHGRHETGTGHEGVHGSYYLGEVDGRHRYVVYVADKFGFRAVVKTNEHGTKTSLPAAAPYVSANGKHHRYAKLLSQHNELRLC